MGRVRLNRRRFLNGGLVGAGLLATAARSGFSTSSQAKSPLGKIEAETPFARIEKLAEGVWAVVSTPFNDQGGFGDMTTVCNGGIIAGTEGVLVVDTFQRPAGAWWVAERARELTGKRPTHVAITHFHADHSGGTAGFQSGAEGPEILATETTRQLIWDRYQRPEKRDNARIPRVGMRFLAPTSVIPDGSDPIRLDLGGRAATIELRSGHTPSDLTVSVEDPRIVFDGDLVWKDVFPNYRDAIPSALRSQCRDLLAEPGTLHVPGHGDVARAKAFRDYLSVIDEVEKAARASHSAGRSASDAAKRFKLPESLGPWLVFDPDQMEAAFDAWYRELE